MAADARTARRSAQPECQRAPPFTGDGAAAVRGPLRSLCSNERLRARARVRSDFLQAKMQAIVSPQLPVSLFRAKSAPSLLVCTSDTLQIQPGSSLRKHAHAVQFTRERKRRIGPGPSCCCRLQHLLRIGANTGATRTRFLVTRRIHSSVGHRFILDALVGLHLQHIEHALQSTSLV
jgi:hypothetical protein